MASRLSTFIKNTWGKEPMLVVSFTIVGLTVLLPILSPETKYSIVINEATPYNYPVSLQGNGNMPTMHSYRQYPQGPSLDWLKSL
uniref:NADH dehydrogenase [ubiquinone] 1 alpha subcomplex subunit 3-like n=1 Tax=Jaculus jaculus TaxID=51337 RepID=UPI001E1B1E15|nr:NADH dehydrogenase [ubiquinone] 1 alpha subcomplex subunit 3-like [Jaculus jaculus]